MEFDETFLKKFDDYSGAAYPKPRGRQQKQPRSRRLKIRTTNVSLMMQVRKSLLPLKVTHHHSRVVLSYNRLIIRLKKKLPRISL